MGAARGAPGGFFGQQPGGVAPTPHGGSPAEPGRGSAPGSGPPGKVALPNAPPGYFAYSDACPSLDDMLHNLQHFRPSWQQLVCHAERLERKPRPAFGKRVLMAGEAFGMGDGIVPAMLAAIDASYDAGINVSAFTPTLAPPYIDSSFQVLGHPLTPSQFDEKLRSISVLAIREKSRGRSVDFSDHWPDNQHPYGIPADETGFKRWVNEVFLPQKVIQAQAAEWLKAESYDPFPKEPEVMVHHTLKANGGGLENPAAVALAQWLMDETLAAVRPHFTGLLYVTSAPRYDVVPEWQQLSYRGWDRVAFTIITECDLARTKTQIDLHVPTFAGVAARDGVAWGLGELDIHKHRYDLCGTDWNAVEAPAYEYAFTALDAASPAPDYVAIGVHWAADPSGRTAAQGLTDTGRKAIRDYFASR